MMKYLIFVVDAAEAAELGAFFLDKCQGTLTDSPSDKDTIVASCSIL